MILQLAFSGRNLQMFGWLWLLRWKRLGEICVNPNRQDLLLQPQNAKMKKHKSLTDHQAQKPTLNVQPRNQFTKVAIQGFASRIAFPSWVLAFLPGPGFESPPVDFRFGITATEQSSERGLAKKSTSAAGKRERIVDLHQVQQVDF